jgi:hypothetical protein
MTKGSTRLFTLSPTHGKGAGYHSLETAMLAAWEKARETGGNVTIYQWPMYIGTMEPSGRLYDVELRQIGVCVDPTRVEMT